MFSILAALSLAATPATKVETAFRQVAPQSRDAQAAVRSAGEAKAILLIHGLHPHPFSKERVARAELHGWQLPESYLVKSLSVEGDVYAFAYSQTVSADEVAARSDLDAHVRRLRKMGYREVILVGHSAGGIVSRDLVEDNPDIGVTKVIQVCAPNGGSGWADIQAVRANQVEFLHSLTKKARLQVLEMRKDRTIPSKVEFVCVVGTGAVGGDGMVSLHSQWPWDLQAQGIPAILLSANHWSAVREEKGSELVSHLVRRSQPRWDEAHIVEMRKKLFGD
jgi:pimeloyl-ACP methyl ester carboxylesterase